MSANPLGSDHGRIMNSNNSSSPAEEKPSSDIPTTVLPEPASSQALTARQLKVMRYRTLRQMSNVRIARLLRIDDINLDELDEQHQDALRRSQEAYISTPTTPLLDSISMPAIPQSQAPSHIQATQLALDKPVIRGVTFQHSKLTPLPEMPALQDLASLTFNVPRAGAVSRNSTLPSRSLIDYSLNSHIVQNQRLARRVRRQRKLFLRHLSRKRLRQTRASDRRTLMRLWTVIFSSLLVFLVLFLSVASTASILAYRYANLVQSTYQNQVYTLRDLLPLDNLKIFDSKGVLIGQLIDNGLHTTVSLDQVAVPLQTATVATEDKNFWSNQGIDLQSILRAALHNVQSGHVVEGGSTITQQLVKNLVVGNSATLTRKLEEIILAPEVNNSYSKRDILEMYLNSIYYGHQAYGIDAAATIYFGLKDLPRTPASLQLDLAQSAMLAGIPSNPSGFDPLLHPKVAFNRFETVLNLMVHQQYITNIQALAAIKEAQGAHFFKPPASFENRAPHFMNFVLDQLMQMTHLKRNQLSRSGMVIDTTLDIGLQDKIQKIAQQHIAELRDAHNLTNAAEVLIDFHTGAIISLLGSIDYNNSAIDGQFDVATQGYRQPGSSFKPYVYVTAFAQGASPAQAIDDAPLTIYEPGSNPLYFSPTNYDLRYHGHMTLRCALQNSLNVPGVKVLQHVGIDAAMKTAYDMGITSYEGTPGYSLVLGGLGVRLIDHTSAIGVFANGGVREDYFAINKIVAANTGKVLYQHPRNPGKQVISPQLAYMMTNVLSDNTSRIPEFYDCNVLQLYANSQQDCWLGNRGVVRPAAAKTGTTNDFRDNWTVGYTTDYVMGVWAGNDNNTPMYNVTGVQGAAPIWHDAMLVAEQGHPIRGFANPGGLVRETVTYPDGVQTTDLFLPGTVPTFVPTPTPTAIPTATEDLTATPAATDTPTARTTLSADLTPAQDTHRPVPGAYCPSDYSFAFAPPPGYVASASKHGWW